MGVVIEKMVSIKGLALLVIVACAFTTQTAQAQREKPEDWDDALDGEWEAPKEDEPEAPPTKEQYLSQDPDHWANNHETTRLWEVIHAGDMAGLEELIKANPRMIHACAEDGRGPLFWAYEYGQDTIITLLEDAGVDQTVTDRDGIMPEQLRRDGGEL